MKKARRQELYRKVPIGSGPNGELLGSERDGEWYHGGTAGLRPGDVLLPGNLVPGNRGLAGLSTCASPEELLKIRAHVYVTSWLDHAALTTYSHTMHRRLAGHPGEHGDIYLVKPIGDLTPVAHAKDYLFRCDRAEILEVLPFYYLTDEQSDLVVRHGVHR